MLLLSKLQTVAFAPWFKVLVNRELITKDRGNHINFKHKTQTLTTIIFDVYMSLLMCINFDGRQS